MESRSTVEEPLIESPLQMDYHDWLAWSAGETRTEWVDGEVVVSAPSSPRHWQMVFLLAMLLTHYVDFKRLGRVLGKSIAMRLPRSGRVPDVLFVTNDHRDRLTNIHLYGPADLVVEVVSEDSVQRDRVDKFAEYAAAGVAEYWIFDAQPNPRRPEFYRLADGVYQPMPTDTDGRYHSAVVPGFWLRPAWLDQNPLPDALDCLFEIAPELLAEQVRLAAARQGMPEGGPPRDPGV